MVRNKLVLLIFLVFILLLTYPSLSTANLPEGTGGAGGTAVPSSTIESACPDSGVYDTGLLKGLPCDNPPGADDPGAFTEAIYYVLENVVETVLIVLGTLFTILMIVGGIQYISSSGSEERARSGKKTLTAAIIGVLIVVLSYTIIKIFVVLMGGDVI